jgi:hypothetical protein
MLKGEIKMLLDYYEETLRELEEIELNLDDLSTNDLRHSLRSLVNRGWLQVETLFGQHKQRSEQTKEEIQKHFNDMLKVVPMTKVKRKNDNT